MQKPMTKIPNKKSKKLKFRVAKSFRLSDFRVPISYPGFTLLEMIISSGIFTALVIIAIGISLGVSNAQIKAADIQAIQDNVRFSLELMTKEMRTGTNFALTSICAAPGSELSFDSTSGRRIYFLNSTTKTVHRATQNITAAECGDPSKAPPFSGEEIAVETLVFRLMGAARGPQDGQPVVTVVLGIRAREIRFGAETTMTLQTTVVPRLRDL